MQRLNTDGSAEVRKVDRPGRNFPATPGTGRLADMMPYAAVGAIDEQQVPQ